MLNIGEGRSSYEPEHAAAKTMAERGSMFPQHISRGGDAHYADGSVARAGGPHTASPYLHSDSSDAFGEENVKPTEIRLRLIQTGDRISDMGSVINRLVARLNKAGVVRVDPIKGGADCDQKEPTDLTVMGADMRNQADELRRQCIMLDDLIASLEI